MGRTALGCGLSWILGACVSATPGSGTIVDRDVEVGAFDGVSVADGLRMTASEGAQAVVLHLDDNLVDLVTARVEGRTLVVEVTDPFRSVDPSDDAYVEVSAEVLLRFGASGGARLDGVGSGAVVEVDASGGAMADVEIAATELVRADASGGARVELSGTAPALRVEASGGAIVQSALPTAKASVSASGGATVRVAASDEVDVSASGGSTVTVVGDPPDAARDISTSGGATVTFEQD